MLKVEAIIEEVVNGEVTQLRIGDDVYAIKFIGYYKGIEEAGEEKGIIKKDENDEPDKGAIIDYIGKNPVHSKILNEIIETVGFSYDRKVYGDIISKYYPHNADSTIKTYISIYRKAIEREVNIKPEESDKKREIKERQMKSARTKRYLRRMGVHFLGTFQKMRIIKEALNEMKDKSPREAKDVLRKYYPEVKDKSLDRYYSTYLGYIDKLESKKLHPLGKEVTRVSNKKIYYNPLDEVKKLIESGQEKTRYIKPILRKYYPLYQEDSITGLSSVYRRAAKRIFPELRSGSRKKRSKYNKSKPEYAIGYDDTYKTWIKKSEYHDTYKKLMAMNYRDKGKSATTENIANELGLSVHRTRAILHYMLQNGRIKQSYGTDLTPRYHP